MDKLAVTLLIQFAQRLPALIEVCRKGNTVNLDDIFPKTREELEAEV